MVGKIANTQSPESIKICNAWIISQWLIVIQPSKLANVFVDLLKSLEPLGWTKIEEM